MKNIREIAKNNVRYIVALIIILLAFLISKNFFIDNTVTSDDCKDGKCQSVLDEISLSDENPVYFFNDIFDSNPGEYYRLSFKQRSDKDSFVLIKETNAFDEENEIKTVELKKSNQENFQEILFRSGGKRTDIKFEKKNFKDGTKAKIYDVHIFKLNTENENEFSKLKPTITGEIDFNEEDQKQTDSSEKFSQSAEPGMLIGQVFKPKAEYITGVSLDMDITRAGDGGPRKYLIELREADFDGESLEIGKKILAECRFSLNTVERYRQENGKLRFPLFFRLEKDKHYFIGINNDKGEPDKLNNIVLKGTSDQSKYPDGIIGVKNKGLTFTQSGSLYFVTYGADFKKINGRGILSGSLVEDLGKGKGVFLYNIDESGSGLIDIYSSSGDINFDGEKKSVYGLRENSYFEYKFYTVYPFEKMRIYGRQPDDGEWSKTKILYSYDEKNWKEIPSDTSGQTQIFNHEIKDGKFSDTIYLKLTPFYPEINQEKFGLESFKVEADLLVK